MLYDSNKTKQSKNQLNHEAGLINIPLRIVLVKYPINQFLSKISSNSSSSPFALTVKSCWESLDKKFF